ncbi:hypothetical protein ABZ917_41430 [Nonomuraea wenchangensis]
MAAAGTVVVAAAVSVTTGMLTQHWAVAWWIATGVLVLLGGGLQAWLTVGERARASQRVTSTRVTGSVRQTLAEAGDQGVERSEVGGDVSQRQENSE